MLSSTLLIFCSHSKCLIFPRNDLPAILTNDVGSCFIQEIFSILPAELFSGILEKLRSRIPAMIVHRFANYVLQALILSAPDAQEVGEQVLIKRIYFPLRLQFEKLFVNLIEHLEEAFEASANGVVTSLIEGCVQHKVLQKEMLQV